MRAGSGSLLGFPWRSADNLWVLALPVDKAWVQPLYYPSPGKQGKGFLEEVSYFLEAFSILPPSRPAR